MLLVAGCGGSEGPTATAEGELSAKMIRLADLPKGFARGDDEGCGKAGTTEGSDPSLDGFLASTRPDLCVAQFDRAFGGEPRVVQSALYRFRTEDDARDGWARRRSLFGVYNAISISSESGGGEAIAFDSKGLNDPGAGKAWRDGRLVVAVYEEGLQGEAGRRFAADLAEKQRRRIDSPAPQDRSAENPRTVVLDDPGLSVPVYWLGERFDPGVGLPPLELASAANVGAPGSGPGNELKLDYGTDRGAVNLDVWDPARWRRFKRTRLGQAVWSAPCARRSTLELADGRAEIYGGFSAGCGGEPDHWLAHAYLDDAVVTVNIAYCYACLGRARDDPYNSRRGMEAVVEGLRRRGG